MESEGWDGVDEAWRELVRLVLDDEKRRFNDDLKAATSEDGMVDREYTKALMSGVLQRVWQRLMPTIEKAFVQHAPEERKDIVRDAVMADLRSLVLQALSKFDGRLNR